ncbi:MAG: fumarylacetoacetase [Rhodoblastus sp.]
MSPNDPDLRSFVEISEDSDFPIQNLPYGIFSTARAPHHRAGVAIGDYVLDLGHIGEAGLLPESGDTLKQATLNDFIALDKSLRTKTRARISVLLRHDNPELRDNAALRAQALVLQRDAIMHLPIRVEGYTDFYSSREHATNVGMIFRDKKNPLLPNWLHMPIGYNGRASTVIVSGQAVRRPMGQIVLPGSQGPILGASRKLDFELEIGAIVGRPTGIGETLTMQQAQDAIFGFVLLNDWSARDIQSWEYVPLGPFQAKAFATTISPWIVTAEALEPFRTPGPKQDPRPLPHLQENEPRNHDIELEASLAPAGADAATVICKTNFNYMYWSSAQQLAHHAICGCAMRVCDIIGSGTISGPESGQFGSMLELSWNAQKPLQLGGGISRSFLEDGDTLVLRGYARGQGYRIGFGEAGGKILPASA